MIRMSVDMNAFKSEVARLKISTNKKRLQYARTFVEGIREAVRFLLDESLKIVPVETKALYDSGYFEVHGVGFDAEAIVGYAAEYAVYVHEDLSKRHGEAFNTYYAGDPREHPSPLAPAGLLRRVEERAKFLEEPLRDPIVQGVMAALVAIKMSGTAYGDVVYVPMS